MRTFSQNKNTINLKRTRKNNRKGGGADIKSKLGPLKPTLGALSFQLFLPLTKRDFWMEGEECQNYDPLQINWLLLSRMIFLFSFLYASKP